MLSAIAFSVVMSELVRIMVAGKLALFRVADPPGGAKRCGLPLVVTVPVLATAAVGATPGQKAPAGAVPLAVACAFVVVVAPTWALAGLPAGVSPPTQRAHRGL